MPDAAHDFPRNGTIQNWRRDRGYGEIKDAQTGTCYLAALAGNKGNAIPGGSSIDGIQVRFRVRSSYQPVDWIPAAQCVPEQPAPASVPVPVPVRFAVAATPPAIPQPQPARPAVARVQVPSPLPAPVRGLELWTAFYHMTHHRNLPGILNHGILSWTTAHAKGLTDTDISDPSVQRWRARCEPVYSRSIHDYAPLYINPKNAMLYVRRHLQHELVILKVSADVLRYHQHVFSDGNAACHNTQFSTDRQIVAPSDTALRALRWSEVPDGKRRRCAEVLVFPTVEARFIITAICSNQNLANTIRAACPVPIVIDTAAFY